MANNILDVRRTLFFEGSLAAVRAAVSTASKASVLMGEGADDTRVENCLGKI